MVAHHNILIKHVDIRIISHPRTSNPLNQLACQGFSSEHLCAIRHPHLRQTAGVGLWEKHASAKRITTRLGMTSTALIEAVVLTTSSLRPRPEYTAARPAASRTDTDGEHIHRGSAASCAAWGYSRSAVLAMNWSLQLSSTCPAAHR